MENSEEGSEEKRPYQEREFTTEDGKAYEYFADKIYFRYISLDKSIGSKRTLVMPENYVVLIFCLQGSCAYCGIEKNSLLFTIENRHCNSFYFGKENVLVEARTESKLEAMIVYAQVDYFFSFSYDHALQWKEFESKVKTGNQAQLHRASIYLDQKINLLLLQILEEKLNPKLKNYFIEAKVTELILYQMDQLLQNPKSQPEPGLKPEEAEKMEMARQLLLKNLKTGISLKSLALEVGTNEFTLKKHFKLQFGSSVFSYLLAYKMEQAKDLLKQSDLKIAEIAEELGYQHPTHFSAAFKKATGMLPKAYREQHLK
ncbi:helix-turn-helix domain-containing protein [Lunatibacter salilacus]|uniref:helix-turn-helix domain-containing protein n=1 Tax=Lunatibacter salilacus TaxID=2483804 RepID=UPI00131B1249|nr:AraC family transcriptional regulator [Lunatibacter salilacus]